MKNFAYSNRFASLDILRLIAACSVVMIHASYPSLIENSPFSANFVVGNICDGLSRIGVPFFLMISGSLILNEKKELPFRKVVIKIFNIVLLLLFWSLFYSLITTIILPYFSKQPISARSFINAFITGHFHLWYLYLLIGLYLITPILRLFVLEKNARYIQYFILLGIIFSFISPLAGSYKDIINNLSNKFYMGFVNQYIVYYLAGWYITHIGLNKRQKFIIYILGILGAAITILGTQLLSMKNGIYSDNALLYDYISLNVFCYSTALFIFIYNSTKLRKSNEILSYFAKLSFGIYVLHPFFQTITSLILRIDSTAISIIIQFIIPLFLSVITSAIINKIPLLRKIIYC